ncbi:MAG: ABC transporter ATP-binding protein [Candidatus Omnitrophica bacterium]|nr:ABC transporter ATP-binding protein [Candidatus Omnitrophota bacterium]
MIEIVKFEEVSQYFEVLLKKKVKSEKKKTWSLKDISFSLKKGEILGIVGDNGAGKTTLLRLICGILYPDKGKIKRLVDPIAVLELGAGFKEELTGRENIFLSASLLGLSKRKAERVYQSIVEFAELGEYIDAAVKTYSQGMFLRLAFSIAINIESELLLIDDVFSVGDAGFGQKCISKLYELKTKGIAIIVVSHDLSFLRNFCERVIFLKQGSIVSDGPADSVISAYISQLGVDPGFVISNKNGISIRFNKGRIFIDYQQKPLFSFEGAKSVFCFNQRWFSSIEAVWELIQVEDNLIYVKGIYAEIFLIESWKLRFSRHGEISWEVSFAGEALPFLSDQHLRFMFFRDFERFHTVGGSYSFGTDFYDRDYDILQRCISQGSIVLEQPKLKDRNFEFMFSEKLDNFAKIFNSDFIAKSRVLLVYGAQNDAGRLIKDIKVRISMTDKKIEHKNECLIHKDDLELRFDQGRVRFYYQGYELTKKLSFYTSLYFEQRWFDSHSGAVWQIKEHSDSLFVAVGRWLRLPLKQIWQVNIVSPTCFSIVVFLCPDEKIDFQTVQTNVMVSDKYSNWVAGKEQGAFPDFNPLTDSYWESVIKGCFDKIGVFTESGICPFLVELEIEEKIPGYEANIVNSDILHRARLLQYSNDNLQSLLPGKYLCFSGRVSVCKVKNHGL